MGGYLTLRGFVTDPRIDKNAILNSMTEYDSDTAEGSRRIRSGVTVHGGSVLWEPWGPV
jgi:hypothetical protein